MKKFLIGLGVVALSLTGLAAPASAERGENYEYTETEVSICVEVDGEFVKLKTQLVTYTYAEDVLLDEDEWGDLNEDGDLDDEFIVEYEAYSTWINTYGEGASLTVTDLETGEEIYVDEYSEGLLLTDEPCEPGPAGPAGADGSDGSDGSDGAAGGTGAVGAAGPAGAAGQTVVVEKVVTVQAPAPKALPRTV